MWVDLVFPGNVTLRVYYEIIPDIIVPAEENMSGHDNGIIIFGTSVVLDEETASLIINRIDDLHAASRNYLTLAIHDRGRREEYIPDMLFLIRRGDRHIEGRSWDAIPVLANDADLMRALFEANRELMARAVGHIVTSLETRVDLYDFDFRQEDSDD